MKPATPEGFDIILSSLNEEYLLGQYKEWQENPSDFSSEWDAFFSQFGRSTPDHVPCWGSSYRDPKHSSRVLSSDDFDLQLRAFQGIQFYRAWGHRLATLDPLERAIRTLPEGLVAPEFSPDEMQQVFQVSEFKGQTIGDVLTFLRQVYCGHLTLEVQSMTSVDAHQWIQKTFEAQACERWSPSLQRGFLKNMIDVCAFEKFLGGKFLTAKRFGLDGGESLIPALIQGLQYVQSAGSQRIVLGMGHRGRLNIMANVLGVPLPWIFHQFEGKHAFPEESRSGDVKYHLGAEGNNITLLPNPSHLESVDPVLLGYVRARQETTDEEVLGVLIHGDASFMGQGVVAESFVLSGLPGYGSKGTLHIVFNNQIGFTADPAETHPGPYASDLAKAFGCPILHVNGDDLDATVRAFQLALDFRQHFKKDIIIDFWCYRRLGHNEIDEPTFTQPLMYEVIRRHPSVESLYSQKLINAGVVSEADVKKLQDEAQLRLSDAFEEAKTYHPPVSVPAPSPTLKGTGVSLERLENIAILLTTVPKGFSLHPKLERFLENRRRMGKSDRPVDWSFAEALAFASLLEERVPIRLSGEDSCRGTFTQRHAVWIDQKTGRPFVPFHQIGETQGTFLNSPLSEMGVMGFELGYSWGSPQSLVLWEAQFGDFANGAQIIIDQYLVSGETKWNQNSGLVLLLPHGNEGQGAEHTSARLERFLQLAAEDNMVVASCSTPANYFHLLRRQPQVTKPLVLMTPKSLLRRHGVTSPLKDFEVGTAFQPVLPETQSVSEKPSRVIVCSGKVYYDLLAERAEVGVPIIRLEQLYPFPKDELQRFLKAYSSQDTTLVWVQEEPYNQGAWLFLRDPLEACAQVCGYQRVQCIARPAAAAPASGCPLRYQEEQNALVQKALA